MSSSTITPPPGFRFEQDDTSEIKPPAGFQFETSDQPPAGPTSAHARPQQSSTPSPTPANRARQAAPAPQPSTAPQLSPERLRTLAIAQANIARYPENAPEQLEPIYDPGTGLPTGGSVDVGPRAQAAYGKQSFVPQAAMPALQRANKAWEWSNTPTYDLISKKHGATSEFLAGEDTGELRRKAFSENTKATRGARFIAGAGADASDVMAGFTSPLSIATLGFGGLVGRLGQAVTKAETAFNASRAVADALEAQAGASAAAKAQAALDVAQTQKALQAAQRNLALARTTEGVTAAGFTAQGVQQAHHGAKSGELGETLSGLSQAILGGVGVGHAATAAPSSSIHAQSARQTPLSPEAASAMKTMQSAQQVEHMAKRVASGQPAVEPPPPQPPKPTNSVLSRQEIEGISGQIAQAPEDARGKLIDEAHRRLTQWINDNQGRVVVDGKIHLAKTPEQAETLARQIINGALDAHERKQPAAPAVPQSSAEAGGSGTAQGAAADNQDIAQARANLGLKPGEYHPDLLKEAQRVKDQRLKLAQQAPVPPMGRGMTTDSPAVEKVQSEARPVPGEEPRVEVKDETPQNAVRLAQPARPVTPQESAKVGKLDAQSGRQIVQPSESKLQNERLAAEAAPELATGLSEIAASVPGAHFDAAHGGRLRPQKNFERISEKTGEGKPPETIGDYLAAQIVAETVEAKDRIIAQLRRRYPVLSVEDNFLQPREDKAGYASANLQVRMPNGGSAEVQIVIPEIQAITDQTHRLYTQGREFPEGSPERKAYWDQAAALHKHAVEAFKERTGPGDASSGLGTGRDALSKPEKLAGEEHLLSREDEDTSRSRKEISFLYSGPKEGEPATLILSEGARDFLVDQFDIEPFRGVNVYVPRIARMARVLEQLVAGITGEQPATIRKLANTLRRAATEADYGGVNIIVHGAPERTVAEELFHSRQRHLGEGFVGRHLADEANVDLAGRPFAVKVKEALIRAGYRANKPVWHWVAEIAAKIYTDDPLIRHLPIEDSANWFADYLDAIAARHGEQAVNKLTGTLTSVQMEIYDAAKRIRNARIGRARRAGTSEEGNRKANQSLPEQPGSTGPTHGNRRGTEEDEGGIGGEGSSGSGEGEEGQHSIEQPPHYYLQNESLQRGTGREISKGDIVTLSSGEKGIVQYVHPELRIVRVKVGGKTRNVRLSDIRNH
jgi:hypothetical protein